MSKKNKAKPKRQRVAYKDLFWAPNEVEMRKQSGEKAGYRMRGTVDEVIAQDLSASMDSLGGEGARDAIFSDDGGEEEADSEDKPKKRSGKKKKQARKSNMRTCYYNGPGINQSVQMMEQNFLSDNVQQKNALERRKSTGIQRKNINSNHKEKLHSATAPQVHIQNRIGENAGDWDPAYYEENGQRDRYEKSAENKIEGHSSPKHNTQNSTEEFSTNGDSAYYNKKDYSRLGKRGNVIEDDQQEEEDTGEETVKSSQIKNMGSITAKTDRGVIHCMTIIGQIEGHYILPPQNKTTKYEHIIPTLVAVEESPDIDGLLIMLNTVGGDVEAGLAIAEMISTMSKPTVSLVLGGGHSIGVPLAVSAKKSFIVPTATMTIHPVRMNGLVVGVPQTMNYFDRMQERIIGFVSEQSDLPAKRMRELMFKTGELSTDVGSVLSGEDAVREGLMDYLGGLSDALDCLYDMIERREKRSARHVRCHRYK